MPTTPTAPPTTPPPTEPPTEPKPDDFWANMRGLTGVSTVKELMNAPKEWLMEQPLIQGLLNHADAKIMFGWLDSAENVQAFPALIARCGIAFLETSHGINRAYNSKAHPNLAGAGETALSAAISTSTERGIYGNALNAFNRTLNLPELNKTGVTIAQDVSAAWASLEIRRQTALKELRTLRDEYFKQLESSVSGTERQRIRILYNRIAKSLVGMGDPPIKSPIKGGVKPPATPGTGTPKPGTGIAPKPNISPGLGAIIGHNLYEINSIYHDRISSIRSIKVNASALVIVPIVAPIVAVTGALATVGITAGIISTIATWFLQNVMTLAGMPAALIPALIHTVTAIVLKVSGSSGAEALRYFAASALKANATLLMTVFGSSSMNVTSWMFLTSMAVPILLVSIVITLAMRNRTMLADALYTFGDIGGGKFQLSQAFMVDTNQKEIFEQFKTSAKRLLNNSPIAITKIIGVGLTRQKKYAVCYDLTKPDEPKVISGNEAIVVALGVDKIAKIATGNFFFDWG